MKELEQPLISIIVPVYKVEKYLKRCVDSILTQTYQNMEIILVDDGSPDNCGAICDRYKETDNRVVVIHKKNGGLSDARNTAIPLAKGEYISFIDTVVRNCTGTEEEKAAVGCNRLLWTKFDGDSCTAFPVL